jgi:hypothetical protein
MNAAGLVLQPRRFRSFPGRRDARSGGGARPKAGWPPGRSAPLMDVSAAHRLQSRHRYVSPTRAMRKFARGPGRGPPREVNQVARQ